MKIKELLDRIIPAIDNLPQCWRIVWLGNERIVIKREQNLKILLLHVTDTFLFFIILSQVKALPVKNFEDFLYFLVFSMLLGIKEGISISIDRLTDNNK